MNKQELLESIENMGSEVSENYPHDQVVDRELVIKLVEELDEPKKPIIPQFVADYIEKYNVDEYGLMSIGDWLDIDLRDEVDKKVDAWLYDCSYCVEEIIEREVLLINAIQRGYGIEKEKEKLYYVPLGILRLGDKPIYLQKTLDGLDVDWSPPEHMYRYKGNYHFTEKEIKDYDERYWAFAVEVAE